MCPQFSLRFQAKAELAHAHKVARSIYRTLKDERYGSDDIPPLARFKLAAEAINQLVRLPPPHRNENSKGCCWATALASTDRPPRPFRR